VLGLMDPLHQQLLCFDIDLQKKSWKNKHINYKETNAFNFDGNTFLI
jgi:hypothetical protein